VLAYPYFVVWVINYAIKYLTATYVLNSKADAQLNKHTVK